MKKIEIDIILGYLLRIGVIVATSVVLLGGCLYLYSHGLEHPNYGQFIEHRLKFLWDVISSAFVIGYSSGIIQLGILLITAIPVLRVLFCVIIYGLEFDWLYFGVSSFVLIVLMISLLS